MNIVLIYVLFSIFVGVLIGNIYGFVPGLLSTFLWPIGLSISIWEFLQGGLG